VTCVWNTTGKLLATFQDPNSMGVTRIAFSPDGSILAVGDENANTYIWNMNWHSS
jgi:WD40 repeat protein